MSENSKKLTVSFGAFSCTLSGFDDPFPVMRQVVDYFQQLSKQDPSFGSHPERPDTEALRALAEQSSGAQVNAEMHGDEVVLSADTNSDAPAKHIESSTAAMAVTVPIFDEEDAFDEIDAEDIDFAVLPSSNLEHSDTDSEAPTSDTPESCELVSDLDDNPVTDHAPELSAETSEADFSGTDLQALQAQLAEIDDEVYVDAETEQAPDVADHAAYSLEEDKAATAPSTHDITAWESELVSDEPLEAASSVSTDVYEDIEDTQVDAEDAALERILERTHDDDQLDDANPLSKLRTELSSLQDDQAEESADISGLELVHSDDNVAPSYVDVPEATYEDDAASDIQDIAAVEAPFHDATQIFEDVTQNQRAEPLRLGFGDEAGLDATIEVASTTVDNRTVPDTAEALESLGLYSEGDAEDDFNWDAVMEAVPSAYEPKSTDAADPVVSQVEAEHEAQPAQPLLLTPQFAVETAAQSGSEDGTKQGDVIIDLEQDDPRDELRSFAKSAGAASLPELLEASAAFVTIVNGRPSFSRGEILGLLDRFSAEDGFSQEARIKSFGKLLRSGRIQRSNDGAYQITRAALSNYEDRAAS